MTLMQHSPVVVVGAGAAGLAAAIAFARSGCETIVIGEPPPQRDGRSIALLGTSVDVLAGIGAWAFIAPDATPLVTMRIIDDTANLFRAPPLSFTASEIGREAFGYNIENDRLVGALMAAARETKHLRIVEGTVASLALGEAPAVRLADGERIAASLVVGADGRASMVRTAAGIAIRSWSYPQSAITAIFAHEKPHRDTSTEFHTRSGPFTLVPLGGNRSSLVWVCDREEAGHLAGLPDAAFAQAAERRAHRVLGAMAVEGRRSLVPMSGLGVARFAAPGVALVGEAAHVFPPIGAQGLNLGLRDVAALRDAVSEARAAGRGPGDPAVLAAYNTRRALDVRSRTGLVDLLNRSLLAGLLPVDMLRGAGMIALGTIGPLRRAAMRAGLGGPGPYRPDPRR